jgi:hypothetical protein
MAFRLRPSLVAVGFAVLFAVIANLSWATALTTTGPWFGVTVSLAVYAVAIALASLLAVVVVLHASARAASLESSLRRLDRRIALLRAVPKERPAAESVHHVPVPRDRGAELGAELDAFAGTPSPGLLGLEREGHDTLVPLAGASRSATPEVKTEVLRLLVRERIALREARARVWTTAAGPVLLSVIFLALAGPMLPGADGFAAAHFQLNTTLVLFLAYGFAPLVAWAVLSLGMMGSDSRTSRA